MPEPTVSPTASAPAPTPADPNAIPQTQPHGYFNQAQLEDIFVAEEVLTPARTEPYATQLAGLDLTPEWVGGLATAIAEARRQTTETGQAGDKARAATLNATGAERTLLAELHRIQSAAKQKHHMLAEDDDPATNFPLDGYLIGSRLNPNNATLIQNAEALLAKAATDDLPGLKTPAQRAPAIAALAAFKQATDTQGTVNETATAGRIARDALIRKINVRRQAIQHAIDSLYPSADEANGPVRRLFRLPLHRPLGG